MDLKKVQKQGRDENTRRLSCCRIVVVMKDWKTTVLLLPDLIFATEVEQVSSLFLPRLFCCRIVFLCFHLFLVTVLFQVNLYLQLILTENFLPLVYLVITLHNTSAGSAPLLVAVFWKSYTKILLCSMCHIPFNVLFCSGVSSCKSPC